MSNRNTGVHLIELVVVMALIAILSSLAYPAYSGFVQDARQDEAGLELMQLALLQEQFRAQYGVYALDWQQLGLTNVSQSVLSSNSGLYQFTLNASGSVYTLRATQLSVSSLICKHLELNHQMLRIGIDASGQLNPNCWQ